jgi:hypothetical protein
MSGGRLRFFAVATSFLGPAGTSIFQHGHYHSSYHLREQFPLE